MNYFDACVLGALQGLTEFLPVSSSGHLVVFQASRGLLPNSPEMLVFDVVGHLGTLLAVAVVFCRPMLRLLNHRRHARRVIGLAAAATAVTGLIGVTFKTQFESLFAEYHLVGLAFLATGAVLLAAGRAPRPRRGWKRFGFWIAVAVGLAQAIAIVPGISRSGLTIGVAMLLGVRRRWATEFSLLIATPAICGAAILKLWDLTFDPAATQWAASAGPILLGGLVAFAVGLAAVHLLLRIVQRSRLHWFSYYVWGLGLYVLVTHP